MPKKPKTERAKSATKKQAAKKPAAKTRATKKVPTKKTAAKKKAPTQRRVPEKNRDGAGSLSPAEKTPPQEKPKGRGKGSSTGPLTSEERRRYKQLNGVVNRGMERIVEAGNALAEIQERRLYREEFRTWDDYLREKYQFGRSYASRLLKASEVIGEMGEMLTIGNIPLPKNEAQVRPLTRIKDPEERKEVWIDAVENSPGGIPIGKDVEEALKRHRIKESGPGDGLEGDRSEKESDDVDREGNDDAAPDGAEDADLENAATGGDPADGTRSLAAGEGDGNEKNEIPELALEFDGTENLPAAANAMVPHMGAPVVYGAGNEGVAGWEEAKLADGTLVPGAVDPNGFISARAVETGLRQMQKETTGEHEQVSLQRLFLGIAMLANQTAEEHPMTKPGIKKLLKQHLPNMPLG